MAIGEYLPQNRSFLSSLSAGTPRHAGVVFGSFHVRLQAKPVDIIRHAIHEQLARFDIRPQLRVRRVAGVPHGLEEGRALLERVARQVLAAVLKRHDVIIRLVQGFAPEPAVFLRGRPPENRPGTLFLSRMKNGEMSTALVGAVCLQEAATSRYSVRIRSACSSHIT